MTAGALNGIKVVEIAGIGPGPCAVMMLADMGAEVTVIDRPVPDPEAAAAFAKYTIFNRGKKSVALNLKDPDAVDALLKIIDDADVLIEGFRPGVMERLGLGPEVCCERNPKLVYGRMTGWGQTGPLSHAAGHDPNYIALTGALWAGGSHEHRPTAPLTLIGDLGGGTMMLVFGILSAIIHAKNTGEGQVVDAAITDGAAYISTLLWGMHNSGQMTDVPGSGWADFGSPWHDTYQCSDFGSDSAPHLKNRKFNEFCCAGVYSTKYSVSNILELFYTSKKSNNLNKFLTINGCKHYNLKFDNTLISYSRKKDFKFKKYSKFKNDSLINYNHFKNYWSNN